jgi:hypothetical protein
MENRKGKRAWQQTITTKVVVGGLTGRGEKNCCLRRNVRKRCGYLRNLLYLCSEKLVFSELISQGQVNFLK